MILEEGPASRAAVDAETAERPELGVTLEALAELKRLHVDELRRLGCLERRQAGSPAVAIPYLDPGGATLALRYRTALRKSADGADGRFRWRRGDKASHLYGLDHLELARSAGWVLIVEGESDCWTAWHYGMPAVGVPGKGNWKPPMASYLTGLEVAVWQEPEAEDFSERIGRDLPNLRVIVAPPGVKDISDAHVDGRDVVALLAQLRAAALPLSEIRARRRELRLPTLREAARPVLEHPDPFVLYREAIAAQGYGGDLNAPIVILLAVTGRVLAMRPGAMPVHLLVLGPASVGKSYALHVVLVHLPELAYRTIDAGSPRTLIYDDAELAHRVAVFSESDSLPAGEDNPAASAVRNMLQDHRLHYSVTVRDPGTGDFAVREISKPGPTTLITTSTRRLGPQLDTRVFILEVPDDHAQIGHALRAQASLELAGGTADPDPALLAFQEYLQALAPWDVVVPFADDLARHLASQPLEMRIARDYARLLSLIKATTVLRHAHREREEQGRWMAVPEDYAEVFRLVADIYKASSSGAGAKVREVVRAVAEHLARGHRYASQSEVMAALKLSKASVSRRVSAAKRGGWLLDHETVKGHPAKLALGEPLPPECGLPTPADLERSTVSAATDENTHADHVSATSEHGDSQVLLGGAAAGDIVRAREIGEVSEDPEHDGDLAGRQGSVDLVKRHAVVRAPAREEAAVIRKATAVVVGVGAASASLLMKRLGLYEAEAVSLLDGLERAGVIGPNGDGRARSVIASEEDIDRLLDAYLADVS
jgi:hypothetical protein